MKLRLRVEIYGKSWENQKVNRKEQESENGKEFDDITYGVNAGSILGWLWGR
jgi:hypothetical protein